mmetsp:Transcript_20677/g.62313  ORF Transcript_20677/g.62313 Transcript_20677/m.62313 type:complete len:219 (+) Transcript_20677:2785-3441(+)
MGCFARHVENFRSTGSGGSSGCGGSSRRRRCGRLRGRVTLGGGEVRACGGSGHGRRRPLHGAAVGAEGAAARPVRRTEGVVLTAHADARHGGGDGPCARAAVTAGDGAHQVGALHPKILSCKLLSSILLVRLVLLQSAVGPVLSTAGLLVLVHVLALHVLVVALLVWLRLLLLLLRGRHGRVLGLRLRLRRLVSSTRHHILNHLSLHDSLHERVYQLT